MTDRPNLDLDGLYGEKAPQKTTILACDDDVGIHPLIEMWVSDACLDTGLSKVLVLTGPDQVVDILSDATRRKAIAAILSDNDMPLMDQGLKLAQTVRGKLGIRDIPFILTSGRICKSSPGSTGLGEVADGLLRSGEIDAMLPKSFNPSHLRAAIAAAIKRRVGLLRTGKAEPAEVLENF